MNFLTKILIFTLCWSLLLTNASAEELVCPAEMTPQTKKVLAAELSKRAMILSDELLKCCSVNCRNIFSKDTIEGGFIVLGVLIGIPAIIRLGKPVRWWDYALASGTLGLPPLTFGLKKIFGRDAECDDAAKAQLKIQIKAIKKNLAKINVDQMQDLCQTIEGKDEEFKRKVLLTALTQIEGIENDENRVSRREVREDRRELREDRRELRQDVPAAVPPPTERREPQSDTQIPSGSYLRSCQNVTANSGRLTASCKQINGNFQSSSIYGFVRCIGDISNINGQLKCKIDWPQGSYRQSCRFTSYTDNYRIFSAECRARNGDWKFSSIASWWMCRGGISNDDGVIRCNR